jgi:hypothetical protein
MTPAKRWPIGTLVHTQTSKVLYRVIGTRQSTLAGWQHELAPIRGGMVIYRFGEALRLVEPAHRPPAHELARPLRFATALYVIPGGVA